LLFFGHVIGTIIGTLLEIQKSSKRNRRFQAKKAPKSLQISDSGLLGRGNKSYTQVAILLISRENSFEIEYFNYKVRIFFKFFIFLLEL